MGRREGVEEGEEGGAWLRISAGLIVGEVSLRSWVWVVGVWRWEGMPAEGDSFFSKKEEKGFNSWGMGLECYMV